MNNKKILYINSCVRDDSRTDRLARALLKTLGDYEEVDLEKEGLNPLDRATLDKRTSLIEAGDYSDPMFRYARQFAEADIIVISAPFWDNSFPASLKTYIENIYVTGMVSYYSEEGIPQGMCRASRLYYVTTAGGPYVPDFSFDYIKSIAQGAFGIEECILLKAEMLDIAGNDPEKIMKEAFAEYGL